MKAKRRTILAAIERTEREIARPLRTCGLKNRPSAWSTNACPTRRELIAEAEKRLVTLRGLLR